MPDSPVEYLRNDKLHQNIALFPTTFTYIHTYIHDIIHTPGVHGKNNKIVEQINTGLDLLDIPSPEGTWVSLVSEGAESPMNYGN